MRILRLMNPFGVAAVSLLFILQTPVVAENSAIHATVVESYLKNRKAEREQHRARLNTEKTTGDLLVTMSSLRSLELSLEEGVPLHIGLLGHWSDEVRQNALHSLAGYGEKASAAASTVLGMFVSPEMTVNAKIAGATCLAMIAPRSPAATSTLTKELGNEHAPGRLKAAVAEALGTIGPLASQTVPLLVEQLKHEDTRAAHAAFRALGKIAGNAPQTVDVAKISNFNLEAPAETAAMLELAQGQHANSPVVVSALLNALAKRSERYLRVSLIETLGVAGSRSPASLEAVLKAIEDSDEFISFVAVQAPRNFMVEPACVTPLGDALLHANPKVRYYAAVTLGRFGAAARPALAQVMEALRRSKGGASHFEVGAHLQVLRGIGTAAAPAAEIIIEMLPERSPLYHNVGKFEMHYLRAFMLVTLADIGVPDSALPFILDGLANSDGSSLHLYTAAAMAARSAGSNARDALPFLLRALEAKMPEHNITFERYFAHFTAPEKYTTPKLEAIRAVAAMGPAAEMAVPVLQGIARAESSPWEPGVPNPAVEARVALGKIQGHE